MRPHTWMRWRDLHHGARTTVSLSLNVRNTKELIVDFRKRQQRPYTLMISGTPVERVSSFKYLGVNISEDLTWTTHIQTQIKKVLLSLQYTFLHILLFSTSFFSPYLYLCIFSCVCISYNCTVHGADLTYISLLIIFCIIVYVTNTNLECTTHRNITQMGYSSRRPHRVPLLSAKNRKRRLQFTQAHQNWTIED